MKKIVLVFLIIIGQLSALDKQSTLKLYYHLFAGLTGKSTIYVYLKDKEYRVVFSNRKKVKLVNRMKDADIVLITDRYFFKKVQQEKKGDTSLEKRPILFTTDYDLLKKSKDIVGASYWRKGRAQLLFIKSRLIKYGISLPLEYNKYTVEAL